MERSLSGKERGLLPFGTTSRGAGKEAGRAPEPSGGIRGGADGEAGCAVVGGPGNSRPPHGRARAFTPSFLACHPVLPMDPETKKGAWGCDKHQRLLTTGHWLGD